MTWAVATPATAQTSSAMRRTVLSLFRTGPRFGAERSEERYEILEVGIRQALGTEIRHQRSVVIAKVLEIGFPVSSNTAADVHDLNGETSFFPTARIRRPDEVTSVTG